jgi:hypothetical protein
MSTSRFLSGSARGSGGRAAPSCPSRQQTTKIKIQSPCTGSLVSISRRGMAGPFPLSERRCLWSPSARRRRLKRPFYERPCRLSGSGAQDAKGERLPRDRTRGTPLAAIGDARARWWIGAYAVLRKGRGRRRSDQADGRLFTYVNSMLEMKTVNN